MNYDRIGDMEVELLLNNNYRENYDKSRCAIFIPLFRVLSPFSSSAFFICFRVATVATKFLSLSPQILRFFRF